jgi:hypothetical protein
VIIYEDHEGLSRIQKILTVKREAKDSSIIIRQLGKGPDYRPILKEIRLMQVCNIIIDIDPRKIIDVLKQAKEIKLFADYCNFVITYLVINIYMRSQIV